MSKWRLYGRKAQLKYALCKTRLNLLKHRIAKRWADVKVQYHAWQLKRLERRKELSESYRFQHGDDDE